MKIRRILLPGVMKHELIVVMRNKLLAFDICSHTWRGCLTKNEVGQSFFIIKKHTKNTRNLKGIGHLRYNVGDESNTKPAVQL